MFIIVGDEEAFSTLDSGYTPSPVVAEATVAFVTGGELIAGGERECRGGEGKAWG